MHILIHKMASLQTRGLYSFLGVHSFLIGMFPFYIPVYLYETGFSLALICCFIAITGIGFVISLYWWDRASKHISLRYLCVFSFLSEFVLLSLFFMEKDIIFILICGFFNGIFNCHFWMIQRFLFLDSITQQNSGKKFGNFQIFVLIVLKAGIFAGGAMLEKSGFLSLYIFCAFIVMAAAIFFGQKAGGMKLDSRVAAAPPLGLKSIARYKDRFNSRLIFAIDGIFLYLESYFWMISLFLIVKQSFWKLGLLVIFLTIIFGIIFIIIKNSIDRWHTNMMYATAVCLYSLSWILRGVVSLEIDRIWLLLILAIITFCTSIFRLAFNKRFFDLANSAKGHEYIFIKSYFSQFFLAVFALIGFFILYSKNAVDQLPGVYLTAAFISLIYLFYVQEKKHDL